MCLKPFYTVLSALRCMASATPGNFSSRSDFCQSVNSSLKLKIGVDEEPANPTLKTFWKSMLVQSIGSLHKTPKSFSNEFVETPEQLHKILADRRYVLNDVVVHSSDLAQVYRSKNITKLGPNLRGSCVFHSYILSASRFELKHYVLYVNSHAFTYRCLLHETMKSLEQEADTHLFACDTDGICFRSPKGAQLPIKLGFLPGEWKNEYPGCRISSYHALGNLPNLVIINGYYFNSLGPRSYCIQFVNEESGSHSQRIVHKSFSLTSELAKKEVEVSISPCQHSLNIGFR